MPASHMYNKTHASLLWDTVDIEVPLRDVSGMLGTRLSMNSSPFVITCAVVSSRLKVPLPSWRQCQELL